MEGEKIMSKDKGMTQQQYFDYHQEMCDSARELSRRKNNDYADPEAHNEDPMRVFRNFMACELQGICTAEQGFLVRLSDKFMRMSNLLRPGHERKVDDETLDDTIKDVVNYVLLLGAYLKAKNNK